MSRTEAARIVAGNWRLWKRLSHLAFFLYPEEHAAQRRESYKHDLTSL